MLTFSYPAKHIPRHVLFLYDLAVHILDFETYDHDTHEGEALCGQSGMTITSPSVQPTCKGCIRELERLQSLLPKRSR